MKKFMQNRRFKHGSLATAITIIVIAVIVAINIVATLLLDKYPLNIDLTSNNLFELSQESIDFVTNLEEEVSITVCVDELEFKSAGDWYKQAYEIITSYGKYGNKVTVDFVDLEKNPTFAQQYPDHRLEPTDTIVETSLRNKKVGLDEIIKFTTTEYGQTSHSSEAEQALTSAIMYVTDSEPITATVLQGLDNADVSGYTDILSSNNYNIETQNLLTEDINPESSLLIIGAPATDMTVEQVKKLEAFLDNDGQFGKSMIFVASASAPVGPILANFLADWGIEIAPGIVVETNPANAMGNYFTIFNAITDPEITKNLKSTVLPFVTELASPINLLFDEDGNRKTSVLATTMDTTYIMPLDADENFDPSQLPQGSNATLVKSTREKYTDSEMKTSTVVVASSINSVSRQYLQSTSTNNADIMVTLANQLTDKGEIINILPKNFVDEGITIDKAQLQTLSIIFIAVVPLAILIIGVVVFLRRRHL